MRVALQRLSWLIAAAALIVLLAQPVSTQVQLAMSVGAGLCMVVLWLFFRGPTARFVFLAMGSLVVLRYLYWRITSTLPPTHDAVGFGFGLLLLLAELYCVFILFVSLIINADPLDRGAAPVDPDEALPSVDIFVPSYNEDASILTATLAAARALDYPAEKLTVWLLDDGGTDQKCGDADPLKAAAARERRAAMQRLCAELGVRYLTRARNLHAKAGNLNNGLAHGRSEIVAVLDADHVPFRSFLRETVGYFARDPRLFLVQTPHAFLNPDPIERNLRTFERMPSENEMFYGITQRGLDKWNGSFFCGSAALLRRTALDEAGGFSGITITEDCETALDLHGKGWTSVYVETPLIAGLQPASLSDFIGQRSRWCQGMFQILILKNPAFRPGLRPIQRLAYLSSMTFWFFPVPRLIFMFAPLLHIFFDMKVFVANVQESIAYTATYIVINLMMQNYLYGRVRWPFMSELYEFVLGLFLFKAIGKVIVSPRKPTFNVTAKGTSLDHDHLSSLAWPFFAVYGLLAVGCVTALYRYLFEPGVTSLMLVVGLWTLFNLITAGAALGVVAERAETESTPSLPIRREGRLTIDGYAIDVAVDRVSAATCTVRMSAVLPLSEPGGAPRRGTLTVAPLPDTHGRLTPHAPLPVILTRSSFAGETSVCELAFDRLQSRDAAAHADLMYGDPGAMRRFLGRRHVHKNLFSGTAQFVWWGLSEPWRALAYAFKPSPEAAEAAEAVAAPEPRAAAPAIQALTLPPVAAPAPAPAPPAPAAPPVVEAPPDWVRLMLENENQAILGGQGARSGQAATAGQAA
ncbi:Glucans biosynthesis glucosyltransferase H [Methylobacterium crusticola]|uniref:Cellulose synthase catalytic subunit [UDP-forming] n=1 Tax=Methylobacterium crusticola TaxID=1697972 RepID=A0ABQ4QXP7_9HYPH|nr:UDP-forming cellulose synthase catalytic subunit [Methylobacterium crusticola]GJD50153.1 Glucans biosynthesis glucosyltransferase H [Methylobacterium crusticola]